MEKKVQTKDEVLAELMEEHVALKKVLESFDQELGNRMMCGIKWRILSDAGRDHQGA